MQYDYAGFNDRFTREMNRIYDFKGKTILDIGCGNGDMVVRIANNYEPAHITGVDLKLRVEEQETERFSLKGNVDGCQLPFEDNSFDFVYSVSTFEHIGNVEGTLREVKRVLKPSGKFYTFFAPLWTSVAGHHSYCIKAAMREGMSRDEEIVDAIPAWGHLYMSADEMRDHILKTGMEEKRVEALIKYIYYSDDINRHPASQTRNELTNAGMIVRKYCERVSFSRQWALDKKGPSELTPDIMERIRKTKYRMDDIGIVTMDAELEKYASY